MNLDALIDLLSAEIKRSGPGLCIRPLRRQQAEAILTQLERLQTLDAGVRMVTGAFCVEPTKEIEP